MRIVWLSANDFGYHTLKEIEKYVEAVVTLSEDSKVKMYDRMPRKLWNHYDLPIFEVDDNKQLEKVLHNIGAELVVVAGWRLKIPKKLLSKHKFIGFHPTLLPKGRRQAPIINTILQGEEKGGVTLFHLTDKIDSGDIIDQEPIDVYPDETSGTLYMKVIVAGKEILSRQKKNLAKGKLKSTPQNEEEATHYKSPTSNEIGIGDSIDLMYRKIRAFSEPYDGAYIKRGDIKLIIWEAELVE